MTHEENERLNNIFLFFDKLHFGLAIPSDLARVQQAGKIKIPDNEMALILRRMSGILSGVALINPEDNTLAGIPYLRFLMLLCRDIEIIKSETIKNVFEFLDYDKNGLLTEDDL